MNGAPLLEVRNVSKMYAGNAALEPLDLTIQAGSIHGFLGKNGAGKSTLVSIIAGHVRQTTGKVLLDGIDISSKSLSERKELGVHLLPQHTEVIPYLSVAENLTFPDFTGAGRGLISVRKTNAFAQEVLDRYGLDLDPRQPAGELPLHDQRRLSIARTLKDSARLVMLDEPTASLGKAERAELFDWIRQLNGDGQAFVFISHYNSEVREICDECSVLRDGRLVASDIDPREVSNDQMSTLVTGRSLAEFVRTRTAHEEPSLELRELSAPGFANVNLDVRRGEILGVVGLPGSGAKELARTLGGLNPPRSGTATLNGKTMRLHSVAATRRSGVCYLTDDRIHEGLAPQLSVLENLHLGNWPTKAGMLDGSAMTRFYNQIHQRVAIRSRDPRQAVGELSGGNQQKVLLGALLGFSPSVIVLDEPTIGVDVGAKEEIHALIDELTRSGMSVLLLTYDLDELCRVVDRVVAFSEGGIAAELTGEDLRPATILSSISLQKASA